MRKMPGGEPLSWCHFRELAMIAVPEKREHLVNLAAERREVGARERLANRIVSPLTPL